MVWRARRHALRSHESTRYLSSKSLPSATRRGTRCTTGHHWPRELMHACLGDAAACTGGHRLGPVGGIIVIEVLVGLIDTDPTSFRQHNPDCQPSKTLSELLASLTQWKFFQDIDVKVIECIPRGNSNDVQIILCRSSFNLFV
jgi:hypothetical protein